MAYDTAELEKKALDAIEKYKLFFIKDVAAMIGIDRQTLYTHELDKLDTIKNALEQNRITVKVGLRKKWFDSDAPATQIALYKLLSDEDELKVLTNRDITTDGKALPAATTHVHLGSGIDPALDPDNDDNDRDQETAEEEE